MTPRRVLLRIKKLRRFLDQRIADAARERDGADEPEARAEAAGRLAAYQEVRGEMIGERLEAEEVEAADEEAGGTSEGEAPDGDADGGEDASPEEAEEAEEAPAGG